MRVLITGSSGHVGEALVRTLRENGDVEVTGLDAKPSPFTGEVGSIADRATVARVVRGTDVVLHTATLHKPHVGTHSRQSFVDTNVTGTLHLLEESIAAGVRAVVFTSTTSAFGAALVPPPGAPAAWIDEDVHPVPRNIYGATKCAAEDLCALFHRDHGLPCIVLRTSRFFPEADDNPVTREAFEDANLKVNEFTYRRVDIEDVVSAHLLALRRAPELGFGKFIISATTPFHREDLIELRADAPQVLRRRVPEYEAEYDKLGWRMLSQIDRVYDNQRARTVLGWKPRFDFAHVLDRLRRGEPFQSELALTIGSKGYHDRPARDRPGYPFI